AAARAAAEADAQDATSAIDFLDLDAGLPGHLTGAGVDGGHARLAVQHENLAAVGDDRRHHLIGAPRTRADVTTPGEGDIRSGDDVIHGVLGVYARIAPSVDRPQTGQDTNAAR